MTNDFPFYLELKLIASSMTVEDAIRQLQAKANQLDITLVSTLNNHRVVCIPGAPYADTLSQWREGNFD